MLGVALVKRKMYGSTEICIKRSILSWTWLGVAYPKHAEQFGVPIKV